MRALHSCSLTRIVAFLIVPVQICLSAVTPGALKLQVINRSGHHVNLFWVNTEDAHELVLEPQLPAPLKNGSKTFVITYTNHIFRIRLPNIKENPGISASIESDYVMGPKDVTIEVLIRDGQLVLDELTYFKEQVAGLKSSLEICGSPNKDGYVECIVSPIAEKMKAAELMNQEVVGAYDRMANTYRNYTCADETLETSAPIASSRIRIGADVLPVYYLLDTPHAKIWYVEDFILPSECKILMDHGRPRLERATVYNDKNGSFITSNKRKAQQAMYTVNGSDDPLASFYHRLFGALNQESNYALGPNGQQGIALIQYNPGDEYAPHCDGACDGSEHITAGRVATAVSYCQVPRRGGATTFSKAGVHVKPKAGAAVFFTYLGDDGMMDRGITEHSGCPVLEGEKWLATMWFRKGVTTERHSGLFDAIGIKKADGIVV